jgi:hypothetical protein
VAAPQVKNTEWIQYYKDILASETIVTLNVGLCEWHESRCPDKAAVKAVCAQVRPRPTPALWPGRRCRPSALCVCGGEPGGPSAGSAANLPGVLQRRLHPAMPLLSFGAKRGGGECRRGEL